MRRGKYSLDKLLNEFNDILFFLIFLNVLSFLKGNFIFYTQKKYFNRN